MAEFEQALQAMQVNSHIPGISAAIARDQQITWAKGFGKADLSTGRGADDTTAYHLASLTKPFASTILLQLVQEGRISLDDPASAYGIQLSSSGVVRVRHLLSHTSSGVPGTSYSYDGDRFGLLDSVISRATGKNFAVALQERILSRLPVRHTAPNPKSASDVAEFSMAMDRNAFLTPQTTALAYAPVIASDGSTFPYGLGWFATDYKGVRVVWHYGLWTSISSLIIKVPWKNVTFVLLGNSDALSSPYPLGAGKLESSPWARLFLDTFIVQGAPVPLP